MKYALKYIYNEVRRNYMDQTFFAFLLGLGATFGLILFVSVIGYCLLAIGLMTMARQRGLDNPWLAWIPIAQLYLLGQLIHTVDFGKYKIENAPLVLLLGNVAVIVLGFIPVIGAILQLAFFIILAAALYKLYAMYRPENATLYLVLSIIFPSIAIGIIIFRLRHYNLVIAEE